VINCSIMIDNDYSIITSSEIPLKCCMLPILNRLSIVNIVVYLVVNERQTLLMHQNWSQVLRR